MASLVPLCTESPAQAIVHGLWNRARLHGKVDDMAGQQTLCSKRDVLKPLPQRLRLRWPCAVLIMLAAGWTDPSMAQTGLSAAERGFVGRWDIAHADETPDHCTLALLQDETIGGYLVTLGKACAKALAWTRDIAAWRVQPDGTLVLADALRHAVISFKADAAGDLTGTGPDRSFYVLYRADARGNRR